MPPGLRWGVRVGKESLECEAGGVRGLSLRAGFYFYDSFVNIGLQAVVPQVFFLDLLGNGGHTWLSVCLLVGAMASFGGVTLSRLRPLGTWPRGRAGGILPLALTVVAAAFLLWLLRATSPVVFTALYAVGTLVLAYVYDGTDNLWLRSLPLGKIRAHVSTAIIAQSIGTITAPFFFALFLHESPVYAVVVAGGCVMAWAGRPVWGPAVSAILGRRDDVRAAGPQSSALPVGGPPASQPLTATDWTFLAYTLCMFGTVLVLAANAVEFTTAYFHTARPTETAGVLLTVSNSLGVLAVLAYMALPERIARVRARRAARAGGAATERQDAAAQPVPPHGPVGVRSSGFSPGAHVALVAGMAAAAVLLAVKASSSVAYILAMGGLAGISFGFFRLLAREYASRRVALFGRTRLLSMFNSLHGTASLLVYGLMTLASATHVWLGVSLAALTVGILCLLVAAAGVLVGVLSFRVQAETRPRTEMDSGAARLAG